MSAAGLRTWSNRRGALLGLGLFWAALALLGLGLAPVLVAESRGMPWWMLAAGVALALALAAIGLRLAVFCLRQLGAPAPVLAIGPEGVFDRRLSATTIPWREIRFVGVFHLRGTQVTFELTPAGDALVRPFERALARLSRLFLLPGYGVVLMGTDARAEEVAAAMRAGFAANRTEATASQAGGHDPGGG